LNTTELEHALPLVQHWIDGLLNQHKRYAKPVGSFGFQRLPSYFEAETLKRAFVVLVDSVPIPPLAAFGLSLLADFETQDFQGITYQDVYFLKRACANDESLHLHELIHTIQWHVLGPEQFLLGYALGHAMSGGYQTNPFEEIAYDLQARFVEQPTPFKIEPLVLDHLHNIASLLKAPDQT
jgi:hypothetical protein